MSDRVGYIGDILDRRGLLDRFSDAEVRDFEALIMPVDTNISIDSVILSDENMRKIHTFMIEQDCREKLIKHRLNPMNKLLFYGASGTGKTYLSKALSNYMGYTMLYVDIANSLSQGTIAINIANIFKLGNILGKCIIFFDEVDSIAWNRDSNNSDSGIIRRATNSLFQYLDQMSKENVFIAASNMLHRLDLAFERRFDLKFEFKRPDNIDEALHKFIFDEFTLIDDVDKDIKQIVTNRALSSAKLSYYELQNIVERAMKRAIIQDSYNIHTKDLYKDIAITERIRIKYDPDKREGDDM